MKSKWIFIIDTDSYAGNFERQMCAYLTGVLGDCGVGEEFSELYNKEGGKNIFDEYIEQRSDDHGCHRPCSCWETKGWFSVGDKAVRESDWNQEEADKAWQEQQASIYRGYLKQLDFVKIGEKGWTKESLEKARKSRQLDIDKALQEKSPKYSPSNSVAIFFEEKPTGEMIRLMKKRAMKFAEAVRQRAINENIDYEKDFNLTIHGFRLIKETTTFEDESI
jgi:hypothetical protein